jgi:hypothetical protein
MLMEKIEIFRKFMKKAEISLQIRVFGPEPAIIEIGTHGLAYGVVRESSRVLRVARLRLPQSPSASSQ